VVFIQKEFMPGVLLNLLYAQNKNIIFDFDDALFLSEKQQEGTFGKVMLKKSKKGIDSMLRRSKRTIVGNSFLGSYAERFCADVVKIPIAIDINRYLPLATAVQRERITFGWIGRERNAYYLEDLQNVFKRLSEESDKIELYIIGMDKVNIDTFPIKYEVWDYRTEVDSLTRIDIGLMPLRNDDWSRGKGGCKLLQYMALAIPTVSSPVGINKEIISDGVNGFLASTDDEWVEKISRLIQNFNLRKEIGAKARETVCQRYSLDKWVEPFCNALKPV
jgi:glycosyltransferase involved in cell wall biosynthesis